MAVFENPSADKFGPPPENAQRARELERLRTARSTRKGTILTALALAYLGLKIATRNASGLVDVIAVLLGIVLSAAEQFVSHQIREERGSPEPYSSPTHITR